MSIELMFPSCHRGCNTVLSSTDADTLAKAFPSSRLAAVSSYETIDGEDAICTPTNGGGQRTFQTGRFPRWKAAIFVCA